MDSERMSWEEIQKLLLGQEDSSFCGSGECGGGDMRLSSRVTPSSFETDQATGTWSLGSDNMVGAWQDGEASASSSPSWANEKEFLARCSGTTVDGADAMITDESTSDLHKGTWGSTDLPDLNFISTGTEWCQNSALRSNSLDIPSLDAVEDLDLDGVFESWAGAADEKPTDVSDNKRSPSPRAPLLPSALECSPAVISTT